jgi:uncharacterized protein (DUF362 family)
VVIAAGEYTDAGIPLQACTQLLEELTGEPPRGSRGPLASLVRPGGSVVIKPNLVRDSHPQGASGLEAITTHPSVTAALVRAASLAVGSSGTIVVCDTPLQSADFGALVRHSRLDAHLREANPGGARVEVLDLRTRRLQAASPGRPFAVHRLAGDPAGYETVDLGPWSKLRELGSNAAFAVGDYDPAQTAEAHRERHAYVLSRTVLQADLIISVPKLKTHCKTGMTGALKNFIGICGEKSFLPHFRRGSPLAGGDEFASDSAIKSLHRNAVTGLAHRHPRAYRLLRRLARPTLRALAALRGEDLALLRSLNGSWPGNDTLWRTVHDVHAATKYWSESSFDPSRPGRRILYVLDAVTSGQGHGPLLCQPVRTGCLMAGWDPVAIDFVGAVLLGIDPATLPVLTRALDSAPYPLGLTGLPLADVCRQAGMIGAGIGVPHTALPAGWESVRATRASA